MELSQLQMALRDPKICQAIKTRLKINKLPSTWFGPIVACRNTLQHSTQIAASTARKAIQSVSQATNLFGFDLQSRPFEERKARLELGLHLRLPPAHAPYAQPQRPQSCKNVQSCKHAIVQACNRLIVQARYTGRGAPQPSPISRPRLRYGTGWGRCV